MLSFVLLHHLCFVQYFVEPDFFELSASYIHRDLFLFTGQCQDPILFLEKLYSQLKIIDLGCRLEVVEKGANLEVGTFQFCQF